MYLFDPLSSLKVFFVVVGFVVFFGGGGSHSALTIMAWGCCVIDFCCLFCFLYAL